MKKSYFVFICLLGLVVSDNSTIGDHSITEDVSEISNTGNDFAVDAVDQSTGWGEWSPWSKWSPCTRSCGGGISRQQRRCRRKPCKGRVWTTKYKICNPESCEKSSDFRSSQCAAFNNAPYSGQLLKWYPHYDPARPCSLICRGVQTPERRQEASGEKAMPRDAADAMQFDGDETIVVQLADKVEDGTRCYADGTDVCIAGECMKVGCDLRVGSNKNTDACGVCGGNGSSCQSRYFWSLESISACSKSCGGGFKRAVAVCRSVGADESVVEDSYCDANGRPEKTLMPCNTHPCTTKWATGEWSVCSASCGGGTRTRSVFCTEENGNETTKLPDHKCSGTHKPRVQESCNTVSCPMWEADKWSECSVTCGTGVRTRTIECRDGVGAISGDCDPAERPHAEQECKTNVACPTYGDGMTLPLVQPYSLSQVSEKLTDQPVPSESTFIAEKWSSCSVTCGEGVRHREVHCKIFLEFSKTIAMLPDKQCPGPKPVETEKCVMQPCGDLFENSLPFRVETVDDGGYPESSSGSSYRSSLDGNGYDSDIKVAPGSDVQTTYSWKEAGYTPCSATCLGGVQDLIINCVRDDTGKTAMPLLCTPETKPEARIRVCNDHPCPPRWNYSEFTTCMSPCGIGIQTRDVSCIHEVTRGSGSGSAKTVLVPHYMCPQPPPADRRYCNVWDCPVKWSTGEWGKCSKSCGGGVKKRKVVCEQIMAQGRKQSREERECPAQKPASEKPCNTRACRESDSSVPPIITSSNTTYNQTDINAKVDLRIGGVAKVFQGTGSVKIRCPVRKFDKTQILWSKDNKEIRKSRKYKISRKGALKIMEIASSDAGLYACIAGNSRAETQLIVKFRSKEQISSEEYLRLGNSVHLQRNANLDSAPANSGESLYTDRAAYGNRFDSEDISHERAFPSKPTRKPHQKKQKTSPAPLDATMMHKEQTVTSLNQPGHHESVESAAPSSASALVPHLSYLISSLKAYWPFRSEVSTSDNRKAAISARDGGSKAASTKYRLSNGKGGDLTYQSLEDSFDSLYRNTIIPDKTFGPDEERIFIDVDPYDLDLESVFGLQHQGDNVVSTAPVAANKLTAKQPNIDYIEESLKNVKRYWQESKERSKDESGDGSKGQWSTTPKDHVRSGAVGTSPGDAGMDVYYVEDSSSTKKKESPEERRSFADDGDKFINHGAAYGNARRAGGDPSTTPAAAARNPEEQHRPRTAPESARRRDRANGTIDYSDALFDDESDEREIVRHTGNRTTDYTIVRFPATRNLDGGGGAGKDSTLMDDRGSTVVEEVPDEDARNLSRDREDHAGSMEKASSLNLKEISKEGEQSTDEDKAVLTSTPVAEDNTTKDPAVESLAVLAVDNTESLVFEWVTTDWSKCSQTCGGSGFQMRGAQCTVRTAMLNGNSTRVSPRTVIGATLCEDAGHPVPQKVRPCGMGRCPQWHTTEWTPCETSRCFNWKTAMQKRDISCRLASEDDRENVTLLDPNKCDEATRPLQRQECYNDACKGVWRVGEWSECTASCEEDGIKYRILQCVWFGTKKPAGNACRDIPRPPVMKTCRGSPCPQSPEDCKDHSQLCGRVKIMNMCRVPLYKKQCCASCR
ncbi:PREDICTED: ADAMTS-like protein 3 isoform X2 [Dinoponera quadriceps]|uniref:ADAMTS-like protein 3 isoform X2 n=1 Tax=Dinoponera quadriceps TaxID=609295 RepID=A0A6P3WPX6_DINQU|nr:PREDICTED: ADAMTS-like protein 3 isoform X2 [Dinoponera quadriceps]